MYWFMFLCMVLACARSQIDLELLDTAKNPFVYLDEQNYSYENHTVVTEDGYRLLLVRIPYNRNESSSNTSRPVVLFVHGLDCSFYDYLITGPGIAFGFKALEAGYDIFLLNTRGNRWSRNHTTLDPDLNADAFWDFSFHDVGLYDLPATIDYILNVTGLTKLSYVGHAQGSTAFLALTSTIPEYNDKIKVAFFLSPIAYLGDALYFLFVLLKTNVPLVQTVAETFHINELLPYSPVGAETRKVLCNPNSALLPICREYIYESFGPSGQINDSILSAHLLNFPAGAAFKQLLHFVQNAATGEFRRYDYGIINNLIKYGQITPPDYNLGAVTTPIALYYGEYDYFAAVTDLDRLVSALPNVIRNELITSVVTNHFDVLMGTLTEQLVTLPAMEILNEYNNL
ncbi:lipase 3 isoform X2 [Anoplophora glabripennis]|uniref:lipase 3 isoform X1 n=1 Tax=Anoplophora glabripennis TaxID=217634 RepID=UPI000874DF67|nr:lipase 3 isoform X1 [Anoplophora glabripennis]XP_023309710.1 lipase 3 isoform X2 [Anoplophora glabripennis]